MNPDLSPKIIASKIWVSDLAASYDFYTRIIGFVRLRDGIFGDPPFDDPGLAFGQVALNPTGSMADPFICIVKDANVPRPGEHSAVASLAFLVADVRAVLEAADRSGLPPDGDVIEAGEMVIGWVRDPDGYRVELVQSPTWPPA